MKLNVEMGELSLPKDFSFEIESKHPFFSDEGTSSVPCTIPATRENLKLLKDPTNSNRSKRMLKKFSGSLSSGVFFKPCTLLVDSASREAGISVSIALDESDMFAQIRDKKLPDIFYSKRELIKPWNIYCGDRSSVYSGGDDVTHMVFFPVAADYDEDNSTFFTINEPDSSSFVNGLRQVTIDGESVYVTGGYGTAAFLYLWALIEFTFTACGYTVESNVFRSVPYLKNICVLHNCVDAVTSTSQTGAFYVRYKDIVPSITVSELIKWLKDKFCAFVVVRGRQVRIELFENLCGSASDMDLTDYMRRGETLSYPDPVNIELTVGTSIEGCAPAAETLEKLIASHSTKADVTDPSQISSSGTGMFFCPAMGKFYFRNSSTGELKMLGTDAFKYSRTIDGLDFETIGASDEFVPMVKAGSRFMPYVGKSVRRNFNSSDKDNDYQQKIMICNAFTSSGKYCGTPYIYTESGASASTPGIVSGSVAAKALTPEAIASDYYDEYIRYRMSGSPEISCKLDIPLDVLCTMKLWTPKQLHGNKIFIKSLSFSISDSGVSVCDAKLAVISEYTDSQEIPQLAFGTTLGWERRTTQSEFAWGDSDNGQSVVETDGLTDYTSSDAPAEAPTRMGVIAKERDRWVKFSKVQTSYAWNGYSRQTTTYIHQYKEYFIGVNAGQ